MTTVFRYYQSRETTHSHALLPWRFRVSALTALTRLQENVWLFSMLKFRASYAKRGHAAFGALIIL